MTTSRNQENNENPKLIYNLNQVADDLITYIKELQHVRELVKNINDAKLEYNKPLRSWIWWPLYVWTRKRTPMMNALICRLDQVGSAQSILEEIDLFFSNGAWEPTSANLYLMTELVLSLPGYSDTPNNLSLKYENLLDLRDIFLKKTNHILRQQPPAVEVSLSNESAEQFYQQLEESKKQELENLPKRDIRKEGAEFLAVNELLKKQSEELHTKQRDVNQLDNTFEGIKNKLELHFKKELEKRGDQNTKPKFVIKKKPAEPVKEKTVTELNPVKESTDKEFAPKKENAAMQFTTKKLDKSRIQELEKGLFGMLSKAIENARNAKPEQAANTDSDEEMILTPPATPELSRAAFEAPVANTKYVAPPRRNLQLNDDQLRAMNRLFAAPAKPDTKVVEELLDMPSPTPSK